MEFLYKVTPTRLGMVTESATDAERAIVGDHFDYLQSLTNQGIVLVFGRTQNSDASVFGIAIFRANSNEEARTIMNNDPAVKQHIMRAELYPYKIAGLNASNWKTD